MAAKQICSGSAGSYSLQPSEHKVEVLRYEVSDWSSYSTEYHPKYALLNTARALYY